MACILIVDDEPAVRGTLRGMLERRGYEITEACNGAEAMKQFVAGPPDLLIIDIIMPERDGVETIRAIRGAGWRTPIIAISGGGGRVGSRLMLDTAAILGADGRITKPVRSAELLAAVEGCLAASAGAIAAA